MSTETMFRFKGRATGNDPTGYYYPRWDRAKEISVVAHDRSEAFTKAFVMLGDHPRFGNRTHYGWTIVWDSVDEVLVPITEPKETNV